MPRVVRSIERARHRLEASLTTALRIYTPARIWMRYTFESIDENPYQPRVAQKVVGLAFLSCVAAWEQFLEDTFLGYLSGAKSGTDYAPKLLLSPCASRTHALRVLAATAAGNDPSRLLRWGDFEWVIHVARPFFDRGKPFSDVTQILRQRLRDAQVIRNRVAHNSAKARAHFKRCANHLLGADPAAPLPRGFAPGDLLGTECPDRAFGDALEGWRDDHDWNDLFEAYISMFAHLGQLLAPSTE